MKLKHIEADYEHCSHSRESSLKPRDVNEEGAGMAAPALGSRAAPPRMSHTQWLFPQGSSVMKAITVLCLCSMFWGGMRPFLINVLTGL